MILLDTHIWVWWVDSPSRLTNAQQEHLSANEINGLSVSVISCWEVAKLVEVGRLKLSLPIEYWILGALAYPGIRHLELTPETGGTLLGR